MVGDGALGLAQRRCQLGDGGRPFQHQVDELEPGLLEECPELLGSVDGEGLLQLVFGAPMVGHSGIVGISGSFVKL